MARAPLITVAADPGSGIVLIQHQITARDEGVATTNARIRGTIRLTMLTLAAAFCGGGADAAVCVRPGDEAALHSKALQSELMVSALACAETERYNAWARKFESELVVNGAVLKRMFRQAYGADGDTRLGQFVTALANDAAGRSATEKAGFCAATARVFERVLPMNAPEFRAFVAGPDFAGRHDFAACGTRDEAAR